MATQLQSDAAGNDEGGGDGAHPGGDGEDGIHPSDSPANIGECPYPPRGTLGGGVDGPLRRP